jgi:uncharacterized protein (DUF1501 family)
MPTTRREFLRTTGSIMLGAAAATTLSPQQLYSQVEGDGTTTPTLIVVYLRGGADPLNTIIPYGDDMYYSIRPTIAIPRKGTPENPGVIRVHRYFGFHPSMTNLAELYKQGMMAPIVNTGSTHDTRSHFDAQDFMERGAPGIKYVTEGWLNRYLTATRRSDDSDLRAVAFTPTLPRSLRGQYPVLAMPTGGEEGVMRVFDSIYNCDGDKQAARTQLQPDQPQTADPTDSRAMHNRIVTTGAAGIDKLRKLNAILKTRDSRAPYPGGYLSDQFKNVAKVINANVGLEVATIDYNGWDHHAYQGASMGTMASMLTELSKSIGAFVQDLGPRMNNTLVLTMTEFGRTASENGNNGSDHGHGGCMMAIGGPVTGGKIYGKWRGLERSVLHDGRDMPVEAKGDFRLIFSETLSTMFNFHAHQNDFFPGFKPRAKPVGFLNPLHI